MNYIQSLKCSEEDCLADFVLKKDARLNNPGACSLEFQSVMQILIEHMLVWDTKTKTSNGKGILGTVRAFAGADEEQGHKTLHQHCQIWVEEINQTLRNALFDNDNKTRNIAQNKNQQHICNVVTTSYGPQFCITHKCIGEKDQETLKTDIPESIFKEKGPDCLRQARHKELCNDIGGGIMFCQDCEQTINTAEIVNQSLKQWKDTVIQGAREQDNWPDTNIPLSLERMDIAAYTNSYHMNRGCALESDQFWGT
jgi:hypothetical protein